MADTTGHSTAPRSVTSVVTTSGSTALTAPASSFTSADVGAPISGTGIPAGATLAAVASGTAATLSVNASASGTVTATVGPQLASLNGFTGWIPEALSRATDYTFASQAAGTVTQDRLSDSVTPVTQPVEH